MDCPQQRLQQAAEDIFERFIASNAVKIIPSIKNRIYRQLQKKKPLFDMLQLAQSAVLMQMRHEYRHFLKCDFYQYLNVKRKLLLEFEGMFVRYVLCLFVCA